jgi:hypothetical protein
MKKIFRYAAIAAALAIGLGAGNAWAKDAIKATVVANGFAFVENGNPLSPGTYAIGTLKIFMIVSATEWPASLGNIRLDLAVDQGKPNPATDYTVPILLRQVGGDLDLAPVPSTFGVWGLGFTGSSLIGITVPDAIRNDPSLNEDGVELVGNLQIEPTAVRKNLDTVTTVRIFAKLVHPDEVSCLRTVSFITDNGKTTNLSVDPNGITINYKVNPSFSVQSLSPSQTLFNTLVVNSCAESKTFDLDLDVDSGFSVPSSGQPVKRYVSSNAAATEGDLIDTFAEWVTAVAGGDYGGASNFGTNLCVAPNTLNGMYSMWVSVDVGLITSGFTSVGTLPAVGTTYDDFMAEVLTSNGLCTGASHPDSEGFVTTSVKIKALSCSGGGCP